MKNRTWSLIVAAVIAAALGTAAAFGQARYTAFALSDGKFTGKR